MELGRGESGGVEFARQEATQPSVGVLDAALLPRRVRVAEVGLDTMVPGQLVIAQELRAAVEGDALACHGRQASECLADGPDDLTGAAGAGAPRWTRAGFWPFQP